MGVASNDLSGPHEATPRVGAMTGQRPGHYFCALTLNPGLTVGTATREVQTETGAETPEPAAAAAAAGEEPPTEPHVERGASTSFGLR